MGLLEDLRAAVAEELAGRRTGEPTHCPRRGCPGFSKRGRDADGARRRLCKGCARTFSIKTHGLSASSKLPAAAWMELAPCASDAPSLRESALRRGASPYTAWFMRMRACEVMARRLAPARQGTFHVDDTHLVASLSGNHARAAWLETPRKPHRNGQDGRKAAPSARSKGRIAICCGVNEYGDCFCEVAAEGAPSAIDERLVLDDRTPAGSKATSGGGLSCRSALAGRDHETAGRFDINMVNAPRSRLKGFLVAFHGVSARRLQRYLDWFCCREQFKSGPRDKRELLFDHGLEGRYVLTRALTHLELHPFENYWDRRRKAEWTRHLSMVV